MRDDTWSTYSQPHRFSGQAFLSPSPRQWLRARVRLISDDPAAFPTLRSLTFVANAPIITAGLTGRVFPREAAMDSLQGFRYTIAPVAFNSRDTGFDRVLILLPPGGGQDAAFIGASVGEAEVAATGLLRGDSLLVELPPPLVRRDSVSIAFSTRLSHSPTTFKAFVFNSAAGDNLQGVVPAEFGADLVFVPEAVAGGSLIRNVEHTRLITPNGDGANDQCELQFTVVKTERAPQVQVFTLDGQPVVELASQGLPGRRVRYVWDGQSAGRAVPPGVYVLRIAIEADARADRAYRLVHVAY